MKTQLLCTFTTQHNLEQSIRDITKNFKIVFDKIYVSTNEDELILEYKTPNNWYCYGDLLWETNINKNTILERKLYKYY